MPATGKVSLTRQTIYCFIPILDLYAAYHIKKLRWYLLIMLGLGLVISTIVGNINPLPDENVYNERLFLENHQINWEYAILGDNPTFSILSFIVFHGVVYVVAVYVIRKWSKKWNQQFE